MDSLTISDIRARLPLTVRFGGQRFRVAEVDEQRQRVRVTAGGTRDVGYAAVEELGRRAVNPKEIERGHVSLATGLPALWAARRGIKCATMGWRCGSACATGRVIAFTS